MRNLWRRLSKLEARRRLSRPQRIVVRCEGWEGGDPEPREGDIDENTLVVVVEYVEGPIDRVEERLVSNRANG